MTSKRFLHKARRGKYSREQALKMNRTRWDADSAIAPRSLRRNQVLIHGFLR